MFTWRNKKQWQYIFGWKKKSGLLSGAMNSIIGHEARTLTFSHMLKDTFSLNAAHRSIKNIFVVNMNHTRL